VLKNLWRYTPLLLLAITVWWVSMHLFPILDAKVASLLDDAVDPVLDRAGQLDSTVGEPPSEERAHPIFGGQTSSPAQPVEMVTFAEISEVVFTKNILIIVVAVVFCIWLLRWFRHRSLVAWLADTARHKNALLSQINRPEAAAEPSGPSADSVDDDEAPAWELDFRADPTPQAPRPRRTPDPPPPPRVPAHRQAHQESAQDASHEHQVEFEEARTLLASHLATQLALQGVKTSPQHTVRLLRRSEEGVRNRLGPRVDDDGALEPYALAAMLGREARRLITGSSTYCSDAKLQQVADALQEVVRVLEGGPESSWASDTIEGFVLGVEKKESAQQESKKFADQHGPMSRVFGAMTLKNILQVPQAKPDEGEEPSAKRSISGMNAEVTSTFLQKVMARRDETNGDGSG